MAEAKVRHRGCSLPLQRVVTDFAADLPFAQAMDKLIEHYGVLLSESSIRRITQGHARRMFERAPPAQHWPQRVGCKKVIAQMDGGMVPIVAPERSQKDQRKGKHLNWKEVKLCLAHAQGSRTPIHGGTLQGDVSVAGQQMFDCAVQAGFGKDTRLHAVGDGAPWIATQVEEKFGAQGRYLVDFFHVCDYLSGAAKAIAGQEASAWMASQKERLKTNRVNEVLLALQSYLEPPEVAEADAPVRRCYRYLTERLHQLDYQQALIDDLPIGSGEIESSHRYVVQQRLKRPGAWWLIDNAEYMLALRLNRANAQWLSYWAENPSIYDLAA